MSGREAAASEPTGARKRGPGAGLRPTPLPWAFAHLAVLTAFALGHPLFDLLGRNPEFFAARGSRAPDIVALALLVVSGPPLIGVLVELLVGLASLRARQVVHLALMSLLTALGVIQLLADRLSGTLALIALSLVAGAVLAFGYSRAEPVRLFLSVLAPAPLIMLLVFLLASPVSGIVTAGDAGTAYAKGGSDAPIVFLGLDEFPGTSIMDGEGRIDAQRFPGFAELAAASTWFPNAHAIHDSTSRAWPAIMDGNYPVKDRRLPTSADHPNSIFTILAKSHRMNVSEQATSVCPRDLCRDVRLDQPFTGRIRSMTEDLSLVYRHMVAPPAVRKDLAGVSETWGDFGGSAKRGNLRRGRTERLERWIASVRDSRRPALNFKHLLLPHSPWQYLPGGSTYNPAGSEPIPEISRQSYTDQGQVNVLQQRHLLQVGFVDRTIRRLIAHLEREGLWDKSLVVVTADHGVSFRKGQFDRREATATNVDEVAPIPLFIKAPGQRKGTVNRANVESTDVLPTILDVLDIESPAGTDGKSAFSQAVRDRAEFKMLRRDLSGWIRLPASEFERRKAQRNRERVATFGQGSDGPRRIYRIGPNQRLLGRRARSTGSSRMTVRLTEPSAFGRVDVDGATVPAWVTGRVAGGGSGDIAVAVNGTVRAVGSVFRLATGGQPLVSVLVPEDSFRAGRNTVEVYEVRAGRLLKMGGT